MNELNRKVIVTCGTGGVGKTTLSAALAFRAALQGKRTVVVTMDPAKRLATSLGLKSLGDHPTDLTPELRRVLKAAKSSGLTLPENFSEDFKGTLDAIMPDTRKTFEAFITELAPNPAVADRVMRNPIFQIFAKEFSGTNEYMALERLYSLHESGKYDCIVLDTPPSRNTLAFLEAPKLLARFFEEKLIRWLVLPANKLVSVGMRKTLGLLEKLTGTGFMTSLFEFASALFEVQVGFTANLKRITELLESPDVGFLMVTVPAPDVVPEAKHFIQTLKDHRFHFDGVALNRTLGYMNVPGSQAAGGDAALEKAYEIIRAAQNREKRVISELESSSIALRALLPELARDVHSVEDLFYVAMAFDQLPGSSGHRPLSGGNDRKRPDQSL